MAAAGDSKVRPLCGGIRIVGQLDEAWTRSAVGTLGLPISYEGSTCFVTAGHAVGQQQGFFVGQPDKDSLVGMVVHNFLEDGQDLALVKSLQGVQSSLLGVWTGPESRIQVRFTTDKRPAVGATIYLQGAESGTVSGTVKYDDADIDTESGEKVRNVVVFEYGPQQAAPGDSGAPVLSGLDDGAECYGVHGGTAIIDGKPHGWFTPFDNISWELPGAHREERVGRLSLGFAGRRGRGWMLPAGLPQAVVMVMKV